MKISIYKALGYLATAGAAATTVLLTASSVGLKKSITETFPNLSDLIQNRPEVKEKLLTPKDAPKPPPQQPSSPPSAPSGPSQTQPSAPADPGKQANDDAQNVQSGASSPGGTQGGASGGSLDGQECNMDTIFSYRLDMRYLVGMKDNVNSFSSCLTSLESKSQAAPVV